MIEYEQFLVLVREIETQGIDTDTALRYAELIGDTPEYTPDGQIRVIENGQEIARLNPLKFFQE